MDFEELQRNWQQQQVPAPELKAGIVDELMQKWTKQQKKLKRNNILVTVMFMVVFADLAWVYIQFRDRHTMLFGGSILAMAMFMLMYLWIMWKGVSYDRYDPASASNVYVDRYLQKLHWQRTTITTYSWIHALLLWTAFMFYSYELTRKATLIVKILIPLAISLYIFTAFIIARVTKKKRQLKVIDELIREMNAIKEKMELL